ncbi:TerC/Alx family metal homeostasis membrane protein [Austwickia chelonae]|uniref:TerC/Alx family metal homeostasis membrane protein n=1 Tax=Austwickia chelonae TaxID=100225 RepID=UPI000E240C53|nr:TerC/Alx family metal homeostasis membrane protein [Austwickia chelonae]
MTIPLWVWISVTATTVAVLLFDILIVARRPRVPSTKECAAYLACYVLGAVFFGIGVWIFAGHRYGAEFFAGWLTEYSLSVDNLFVFLVIMAKFKVPERFQQTALMVGIVIALILRAIFIAAGAAVINRFSWMFYIFGIFLIITAYKLFREALADDEEEDFEENAFLRWVEHRFPATQSWDAAPRLLTNIDGSRVMTPMLIVILALGTTDLLFALDSIPAIYGLTSEPFLVLTANIFALMGLRQLYFLIGDLLKRLEYLGIGLSVLLGFIGVKLILHALHENTLFFINGGQGVHAIPEIPISISLGMIILILAVTTVASLIRTRNTAR